MKRNDKHARLRGTWELELLGALAGFLILVCAGVYFLADAYEMLALRLALLLGAVLNAVLGTLEFKKNNYIGGLILAAVALILLILFMLLLAGLEV